MDDEGSVKSEGGINMGRYPIENEKLKAVFQSLGGESSLW